ncbi:MAG: type II toxin-antitoxin system RelE/ParE family toxin [Candidatus Angelobacter sp.]
MKAFVFTPLAARDLNEIWDYLASDNIEAADRVLGALEKALHGLAKNPGKGHWRDDLADRRHRFFLVYSYLIVYRPENQAYAGHPCAPRLTGYPSPSGYTVTDFLISVICVHQG